MKRKKNEIALVYITVILLNDLILVFSCDKAKIYNKPYHSWKFNFFTKLDTARFTCETS